MSWRKTNSYDGVLKYITKRKAAFYSNFHNKEMGVNITQGERLN